MIAPAVGALAVTLLVAAGEPAAPSGRTFDLALRDPPDRAVASLEPRVVTVPSGPGAKLLEIEFQPDTTTLGQLGSRKRVGWVVVRAAGSTIQRLEVSSAGDARWFLANANVVDVDFDGHPDVVTLAEFGASWARWDVWRFDPRGGRFVRDALARDFSRLKAARLTFDLRLRTIHATNLSLAADRPAEEFVIANGRLVPAGRAP